MNDTQASGATVLVTGGSGFLAGHVILQLLAAGYGVRTTVRNVSRADSVRDVLRKAGGHDVERVVFVAADLERDEGWSEAVAGCEYVLHVASPFPATVPKSDDELVIPARDGTLRVLRAAREAGVKRVVVTSSFAAVGYGHPAQSAPFDETAWTDIDARDIAPYTKSKTIAERAAWDFIAREGGALELSVVNPVAVFGPALGPDLSTSIVIIKRMLDGDYPRCPRIALGVVDVRDTADLHLRAMIDPAAKGERFLAVTGDFVSLLEIANVLRNRMGPAGTRVPKGELPDWVVRLAAIPRRELRQVLGEIGKQRNATSAKAQRLLGWSPRSAEESIVASAESLLRLGLIPAKA
jgi:nucleoside-diphosphate-sugar epimerase